MNEYYGKDKDKSNKLQVFRQKKQIISNLIQNRPLKNEPQA